MNMFRGARTAITTVVTAAALVVSMAPAQAAPVTRDAATAVHDHSAHDHGTGKPELIDPNHHKDNTPKHGRKGVRVPTADLYQQAFDDATPSVAALDAALTGATTGTSSVVPSLDSHVATTCYGSGSDGNRVQVVYARDNGTTSRYTSVLPVILNEVRNVDDVLAVSAAKTNGGKRVRWVTDANCDPTVLNITLPTGTLSGGNWSTFRTAMANAGLNAANRKYLIFGDANAICGLGDLYSDTRASSNYNDGFAPGAMYARVDSGCWNAAVDQSPAAHELFHTLGAVQPGAPHATTNGHCYDENDQMCYDDGSGIAMQNICASEALLDCKNDDYFAVNPTAGSWLASNWNTANSSFLADATPVAPTATDGAINGPTSVYAGYPFTLTASATGATSYQWSGLTPTGGQGTNKITAAFYGTGTFTVYVKIGLSSGRATTVSQKITVTRAPAPTATLAAPTKVSSGTAFKPTLTVTGGIGPFIYEWTDSTMCVVTAGHGTVAPTYTCTLPTGSTGGSTVVQVRVSQSDGQAVTLSSGISVTLPRAASAATITIAQTATTATITGWLTKNGAANAYVPVTIQKQNGDGTWPTTGASLTTNSSGKVTYTAPGTGNYRMVYAGNASIEPATSNTVTVKTPTVLALTQSGDNGTALTGILTADGAPMADATVTVERLAPTATTWAAVATATTDSTGTVTYTAPTTTPGTYRFTFAATSTHLNSASAASAMVRASTSVTLTPDVNRPTVLTGTAKIGTAPMANTALSVQRMPLGTDTWAAFANTTTSSTGTFTYTAPTATAAKFRVVFTGSTTGMSSVSAAIDVLMSSTVTATINPASPNVVNGALTGGDGQPLPGSTITVQRLDADVWTDVTTLDASAGTFTYAAPAGTVADYRFTYTGNDTTTGSLATATTKIGSGLTLTQSGTGALILTGTLTRAGAPLADTVVTVQRQQYGTTTWTPVTTLTSDATGTVTYVTPTTVAAAYRFAYAGDATTAVTASPTSTLVKMPTTLSGGFAGTAPVTMTATLTSADGKPVPLVGVTVQRRLVGSTVWAPYTTVKVSSTGAISYTAPTTTAASYRFIYAGGATTEPSTGMEVAVKVPVTVTATVSGTWPKKATATFKDKATGKALSGVPVTIRWRSATGSTYYTIGAYKTNSYGQVSYSTYPKTPRVISFTYTGSTTYLPVTGYATMTTPSVLSASVTKGRPNYVKARLTTKSGSYLSGRTVYLQRRYYGSSKWYTITSVKTSSTGYVSSKQQPKRKTYYRWYFKGESGKYTAVYSSSVYVTY